MTAAVSIGVSNRIRTMIRNRQVPRFGNRIRNVTVESNADRLRNVRWRRGLALSRWVGGRSACPKVNPDHLPSPIATGTREGYGNGKESVSAAG